MACLPEVIYPYTAKPNKRHALISARKRKTKNIMKEKRRGP